MISDTRCYHGKVNESMKETSPLVSGVITTYKRDVEVVEKAVKSIINQDYDNIELLVVNDDPSDVTLVNAIRKMLEKYSALRHIEYIVVEKNGGACKARNIGASKAHGEYISFLDDDDEWLENKISCMVAEAVKKPGNGIIYCNAHLIYEGKGEKELYSSVQPSGDIFSFLLAKNIIGSCSFPMFRLDVFRNCNGFNEEMPAFQDWELYLRMLKKTQALYVNKILVNYYFYNGERISSNSSKRLVAYEKIRLMYEEELKQNKKSASSFYNMGGYFYSVARMPKKAFYYWGLAVKNRPFYIHNIISLFKIIGRIIVRPKFV